MQITGAELFVKALLYENVDILFAYPGGQAIDLFNALYGIEEIDIIFPRHEQGLIHAADGYARSTGKVGVCLVTSGPGATNLVTGIATANYDCVPLVCFTGQVPTYLIGNDAFQEVDIVKITKSITKSAVTVRKREELADVIKNAFSLARSGKPGVVVVDLPKDIQQALGSADYPGNEGTCGDKCDTLSGAKQMKTKACDLDKQIEKALNCLKRAERPLFFIGRRRKYFPCTYRDDSISGENGDSGCYDHNGKRCRIYRSSFICRQYRDSWKLCGKQSCQFLRCSLFCRRSFQRPDRRKSR